MVGYRREVVGVEALHPRGVHSSVVVPEEEGSWDVTDHGNGPRA